ncbi:hypothetical protein MMC17_009232 [Xylographa soralifera]|nr:hypothetical protein [Xylographa soralifera]
METSGVPIPSMTDYWCTTVSCWDSTLDPCTLPLSSENPLDIPTWSGDYQVSPAPDLEPLKASILDRLLPQSCISAGLSVSKTARAVDEVEVSPFKADLINPCPGRPSQVDHGLEDGPTGLFQKARRGRGNVKHSSQDYWERHRSTIKRLYLDEEKCLEKVMQYMREQFGFSEKKPAYKRMLSQWGISKNIPASQMNILAAKARKRKTLEGKDTHFYVHGRLLEPSKLIRFNGRKSAKTRTTLLTGAATPPCVRYVTPPLDSSSSIQGSSPRDMNYSFSDDSSSLVQTPQSSDMIYSMNHECLQKPVDNDLPIPSIELPKQNLHIASWESALYDELVTQLLPDVPDEIILENSPSPHNQAEQRSSPLIPRLPCGIFKPPVNADTITEHTPSRTVPDGVHVFFDNESSGNSKQDNIPQTCNRRPSTVYSDDRLSQRQRESLLCTVAALEKVKDMILYHYGPENEIFLQQSLGLGLLYQKLLITSKCDKVLADLGTGYSKFCLPVEGSQWTEDDLGNASLPLSEYICCAQPVLEHCTCDQLRELARRNRARMSLRDFQSLQARAIACYLYSGRIGQAVDGLLDLEGTLDPLAMEAYLQSVLEILESYSIDYLNWNRFVPFIQRTLSTVDNKALCGRLHVVSYQLWIAQKIPLEAHLRLVTCSMKYNLHPQASNALAMTEDQLIQQVHRSNKNEFLTQIRIMTDVRTFIKHYQEQGLEDMAERFVLRIWEKCKDSWGLYNSETLHVQALMRGPYAGRLQQILAPGAYDGAMVFDRSFG